MLDNKKDTHTLNTLNNLISEEEKLVIIKKYQQDEMFRSIKLPNATTIENSLQ